MKKRLEANRVIIILLSLISILFLLNCATLVYRYGCDASETDFFFHFLNMENENNLPTTYSALQLLFAAVLLYNLFKDKLLENDRFKWHWGLLSLAFFYLCLDEAFELHEKSMSIVHRIFNTGGVFFYAWIIPAGTCLFVMSIIYFKFMIALPSRSRSLFIISAVIYVGSAIGFEMIEGPMDQSGNWMNLPYAILVTVEETLEMLGIALFCYAVIDYNTRRKIKTETEV